LHEQHDLLPLGARQAADRLVQQQQLWPGRQGGGEHQPLALEDREQRRRPTPFVEQAAKLQRIQRRPPCLPPAAPSPIAPPACAPKMLPTSTLLSTVCVSNDTVVWNVRAIPCRQIRSGPRRWISWPPNRMIPRVAGEIPLIVSNSVVLPAPFGPTIAKISPC